MKHCHLSFDECERKEIMQNVVISIVHTNMFKETLFILRIGWQVTTYFKLRVTKEALSYYDFLHWSSILMTVKFRVRHSSSWGHLLVDVGWLLQLGRLYSPIVPIFMLFHAWDQFSYDFHDENKLLDIFFTFFQVILLSLPLNIELHSKGRRESLGPGLLQ